MIAFHDRLREIRESLNLSQNEFSKRLGISRVSLTHYEAGDRTPDISFLKRLHEETGISLYYVLCMTDSKDDAWATMQQNTGLSEEALLHFAEHPISSKVINHLVTCGALASFTDRAAIMHDDTLLLPRYQQRGWDERAQKTRDTLMLKKEMEINGLLVSMFIDKADKSEPFGIQEDLLPSAQAYESSAIIQRVQEMLGDTSDKPVEEAEQ